jgi:hypothetical protein
MKRFLIALMILVFAVGIASAQTYIYDKHRFEHDEEGAEEGASLGRHDDSWTYDAMKSWSQAWNNGVDTLPEGYTPANSWCNKAAPFNDGYGGGGMWVPCGESCLGACDAAAGQGQPNQSAFWIETIGTGQYIDDFVCFCECTDSSGTTTWADRCTYTGDWPDTGCTPSDCTYGCPGYPDDCYCPLPGGYADCVPECDDYPNCLTDCGCTGLTDCCPICEDFDEDCMDCTILDPCLP